MSEARNDRLYCREQVQSVDPLFRLSHVFAGPGVSDRALAINALFAAIEEICSTVSDEAVAMRKLSWWRGEMERAANGAGDHPISAELKRAGAISAMPEELVHQLLMSAEARIDPKLPRDSNELESVCLRTGLPQVRLELAVGGARVADESCLRGAAARRGLIQLIRENPGCENRAAFWWVPLDLLARHGLSRGGLTSSSNSAAVRSLMSELLGLECYDLAFNSDCITDISSNNQNVRHMFAADSLLTRKIKFMNRNSYFMDRAVVDKTGFGDLLCCWRAARRVSLSK